MPGNVPEYLFEGFVEDAFHEAYLALWRAIEGEGLSPEALVQQWTGRKKSTVYAWRQGGQLPRAEDLWRLVRGSTSGGFLQMARGMIAPVLAFSLVGSEVLVNHTYAASPNNS